MGNLRVTPQGQTVLLARLPLCDQTGIMSLIFVSVVLPLIFVAFALSVDLTRVFSERRRAQQVLDEAALLGAKHLPYPNAATQVMQNYLNQYRGDLHGQVSIRVSQQTVDLSLSANSQLIFPPYFGVNGTFPYDVRSTAAVTTHDLLIFLDNSSYLGPPIDIDAKDGWGEGRKSGAWPAATYFKRKENELIYQGKTVAPRIATQQCFNPAFSAFKELAIRLYDHAVGFSHNSVGVLMGPAAGTTDGVNVARTVSASGMYGASFENYRSAYAGDATCLAAARSATGGYQVPPLGQSFYPGSATAVGTTNLPTREIIWSRAVQRDYSSVPPEPRIVSISKVLRTVQSSLIGSPTRGERGGLARDLSTTVFLLLGDLPWERVGTRYQRFPDGNVRGALNRGLRRLNNAARTAGKQLMIYFVTTRHQGNYGEFNLQGIDYGPCAANDDQVSLVLCQAFLDEGSEFEQFLAGKRLANLQLFHLRAPDVAALAQDVASVLPVLDKATMLLH